MGGAAIDTTSNSANWMFLLLAKNQDKQDKLRAEIQSVVPSGDELNIQHINQLHYLKATLRESLRVHPTAPFFSRLLKEDTVIGGYMVPKGTVILINSLPNRDNPDIYRQPDKFRPERWLRGEEGDDIDPHANLPFGHGVRMCIGRRVAELELQTLAVQVLLKKRIELADPSVEIEEKTRLVLLPDKDVPVKLVDL